MQNLRQTQILLNTKTNIKLFPAAYKVLATTLDPSCANCSLCATLTLNVWFRFHWGLTGGPQDQECETFSSGSTLSLLFFTNSLWNPPSWPWRGCFCSCLSCFCIFAIVFLLHPGLVCAYNGPTLIDTNSVFETWWCEYGQWNCKTPLLTSRMNEAPVTKQLS